MPTVLIVDDDAALRRAVATALTDLGHQPALAENGEAALAWLSRNRADAVLLDLRMPGMDGMDVLRRIRARDDAPPVAILTAVPTSDNTIEAMRLGAADHLAKPVGRDGLRTLLERMLPRTDLAVPAGVPQSADADQLVGMSGAMREVQKAIGLLADSDATVLLRGETGTGKEIVARAIHRHGKRARAPFVAVNCAAIPTELLESLLFGHVRGAFTGAVGDRVGSFREAEGGTLFLDEIGDMDLAMQAKLLRALQEREIERVGESRPIKFDARVVAASNNDLKRMVKEGTFREDLFYRLNVFPITIPPLRERVEDIPALVWAFVDELSAAFGRKIDWISNRSLQELQRYPWPGNVRELRNLIERELIAAQGQVLTPRVPQPAAGRTGSARLVDVQTEHIRAVLESCGWRIRGASGAAQRLGIKPTTLESRMARLGIARNAAASPLSAA
jgi:DNA-binding NtrC family response regulator